MMRAAKQDAIDKINEACNRRIIQHLNDNSDVEESGTNSDSNGESNDEADVNDGDAETSEDDNENGDSDEDIDMDGWSFLGDDIPDMADVNELEDFF